MVRTNDELEGLLNKLDRHHERVEAGMYLVGMGSGQPPMAVRMAPPVLVVQVGIGPAPKADGAQQAKLFRRLLELNGSDLLHAAYALEDSQIVLTAALELDNLDLNELEAVFADVDMALSNHVPTLRKMVDTDA